jgi:hypothetical protein
MTRAAADAIVSHFARQPIDAQTKVIIENTEGDQAEQLAIADAFANVDQGDGKQEN